MQQSMERLSSGLRINSAADDAAGMAVSNKMESQLRGMNVAIRNSQDGISLVQTAEAGMGEITNMIIRMRELSVQMNNGVYTDADRTNAQLEVTALLAEIDKIATNTAFNDVKVLDGSYQKDLRAGNTNAEVIGVSIKRMNTDSLGGNTISSTATTTAVAADRTSTANTQSSIVATAVESTKVQLKADKFSAEMQAFAANPANAGGTYTISGTNANLYQVNGTTIESRAAVAFDTSAGATNSHTFEITYTSGINVYKDTVTLNITQNTDPVSIKSATTVLTAAEAVSQTFDSVGANGKLSTNLGTFVTANANGTWAVTGADSNALTISNAGVVTVTGGTNYEAKNSYAFNVEYTSANGDKFVEGVTLNVTDLAERQYTITAPTVPGTTYAGDTFSVTVDGQTVTTAAIAAGGDASYTIAKLSTALNTANAALGTPADGTFSVSGNDLVFTYNDKATVQTSAVTTGVSYNRATPMGTVNVTEGTAGSAEVVTIQGVFNHAQMPARLVNDKVSVKIGGTTVTTAALTGAETPTQVVAALEAAKGGLAGAFTLANTNDIVFTYSANGDVASTDNAAATYISGATGTVTQTAAGVNHPGLTTVTQTSSAAGTATAQRAGNFANRSSTEIVQAKSTISLVESAKINFDKTAMSAAFTTYVGAHTGGKYSLTGTDAKSFSIDQTTGMVKNELNMDFETKASFDINVVYTDTNNKTFTEAVTLVLTDSTADSGTHLADLNVGTQSGAASAITILDLALNQISASQAELGAIQNRLQHNIDNLSMGSMLTETARGRIVDADFAKETSELSKQQILSQAATSMLAQANQSKQSVLALLQ
jgi:flagellin